MFFDMPANRTVDFKGSTSVSIKTTDSEKSQFTVILSCMADGTKLKPAVLFKRKTMPKEKFPSWFKRPGALLNPNSLLVWDMFHVHLLDSVKCKLKERKTRQSVIPGGATSILQPLDVSLNKPFKTSM